MPAHTQLKRRHDGQGTVGEQDQIDFKQQLLQQESLLKKRGINQIEPQQDENTEEVDFEPPTKRIKIESKLIENPFEQDADNSFGSSESSESDQDKSEGSSGSSSSDEDSEDSDELELMREYAKIKKEREEEQRKKELEKVEELRKRQQEEVLTGNPLLNQEVSGGNYSLKRKWHEETVFKNQARNVPEDKKRFVNDTVRSDFHRRFLAKAIQ